MLDFCTSFGIMIWFFIFGLLGWWILLIDFWVLTNFVFLGYLMLFLLDILIEFNWIWYAKILFRISASVSLLAGGIRHSSRPVHRSPLCYSVLQIPAALVFLESSLSAQLGESAGLCLGPLSLLCNWKLFQGLWFPSFVACLSGITVLCVLVSSDTGLGPYVPELCFLVKVY